MAKILAVDDELENRATIERFLNRPGIEVHTVDGAHAALDLAAEISFDLILLDVLMPGVNGFETCRRLKADPRTSPIPVIFVTGNNAGDEDRMRGFDLGAVDYLTKPIRRDELVARIGTWLRIHESQRELQQMSLKLSDRVADLERRLRSVDAELGLTRTALEATSWPDVSVSAVLEPKPGGGPLVLAASPKFLALFGVGQGADLGDAVKREPDLIDRLREMVEQGDAATGNTVTATGADGRQFRCQLTRWSQGGRLVVLDDVSKQEAAAVALAAHSPVVIQRPAATPVDGYRVPNLIGSGGAMALVHQRVGQLRGKHTAVLIGGESGTGKELVAKALHFDGPHWDRPYIPIHCGAISPSLIESELFGYVQGAFTGATGSKRGLFKAADGGTVFLDEVAEMSLELQVKLLRVLQLGEIRPVGAIRPSYIDVRIVAATNQNLTRLVLDEKFRRDLYFRLAIVVIDLPPLRDRIEDVPALVEYFLHKVDTREHRDRPIRAVSKAAMDLLMSCSWPGNVRQLEGVVERAYALNSGEVIQVEDLPDLEELSALAEPSKRVVTRSPGPTDVKAEPDSDVDSSALSEKRDAADRRAILAALEACGYNRGEAALRLGIARATFFRRVNQLGIKLPPPRRELGGEAD